MTTETLQNTDISARIEDALYRFIEAVEHSSDLKLVGTAFPVKEEVFVIRDHSKAEGVEGAYVEVAIEEVVRKVTNAEKAQEFISVIQNERKGVVLNGITRIVGYYSRVNNWNRSKVGELRDRAKGSYGLTGPSERHGRAGKAPEHQCERLKTIDNM